MYIKYQLYSVRGETVASKVLETEKTKSIKNVRIPQGVASMAVVKFFFINFEP